MPQTSPNPDQGRGHIHLQTFPPDEGFLENVSFGGSDGVLRILIESIRVAPTDEIQMEITTGNGPRSNRSGVIELAEHLESVARALRQGADQAPDVELPRIAEPQGGE
jgi:hypothetical protein